MNELTDRVLADWLDEGPETGPRDGLERALAATRRVGQRPGWTLPERWIPMQLATVRTRSQLPAFSTVSLLSLIVALVAAVVYIGSQRPQSPPFRNGAIAFAQDGDLYIADQLGGMPRVLVGGPEDDSHPIFSLQGDRIAFVRSERDAPSRILTINLDGSGLNELAVPGVVSRLSWSPDGSTLLSSNFNGEDWYHLQTVQSDGSGSRMLDIDPDLEAHSASWRPDGRSVAFNGRQEGDLRGVFIADPDGSNARQLPVGPVEYIDRLEWSPDGQHLSFMGLGGEISIADIDANGAMTGLRRLELSLPVGEAVPMWSPDGTQLAFQVVTDSGHRAGIVNSDGSGYRVVGPEVYEQRAMDLTWAPDGRSLVIFEHPRNVQDVPVGPMAKVWSVDVATGEQTEVQTPVASWQRLAP